ncbi:MAG: DNA starvation/stationary phase protection protein [Sediminicola sp.]
MEAKIGIKEERLELVSESLAKIMADEMILYTKTKKAHWIITGADFYSKHLFFEDQYKKLEEIIDEVAERIRAIGHFPPVTLEQYLALTHLTEKSMGSTDSLYLIKELLADHEAILMHIRQNIDRYATDFRDAGTSDYITGLMEVHEKMGWMLRSHI